MPDDELRARFQTMIDSWVSSRGETTSTKLRRMFRNLPPEDVDDAVQKCFLKLLDKDKPPNYGDWLELDSESFHRRLYRCLINESKTAWRNRRRDAVRRRSIENWSPSTAHDCPPSIDISVYQDKLISCVIALDDVKRSTFSYLVSGFRHDLNRLEIAKKIADNCGLTVAGARSRVTRTLHDLRICLTSKMVSFSDLLALREVISSLDCSTFSPEGAMQKHERANLESEVKESR